MSWDCYSSLSPDTQHTPSDASVSPVAIVDSFNVSDVTGLDSMNGSGQQLQASLSRSLPANLPDTSLGSELSLQGGTTLSDVDWGSVELPGLDGPQTPARPSARHVVPAQSPMQHAHAAAQLREGGLKHSRDCGLSAAATEEDAVALGLHSARSLALSEGEVGYIDDFELPSESEIEQSTAALVPGPSESVRSSGSGSGSGSGTRRRAAAERHSASSGMEQSALKSCEGPAGLSMESVCGGDARSELSLPGGTTRSDVDWGSVELPGLDGPQTPARPSALPIACDPWAATKTEEVGATSDKRFVSPVAVLPSPSSVASARFSADSLSQTSPKGRSRSSGSATSMAVASGASAPSPVATSDTERRGSVPSCATPRSDSPYSASVVYEDSFESYSAASNCSMEHQLGVKDPVTSAPGPTESCDSARLRSVTKPSDDRARSSVSAAEEPAVLHLSISSSSRWSPQQRSSGDSAPSQGSAVTSQSSLGSSAADTEVSDPYEGAPRPRPGPTRPGPARPCALRVLSNHPAADTGCTYQQSYLWCSQSLRA